MQIKPNCINLVCTRYYVVLSGLRTHSAWHMSVPSKSQASSSCPQMPQERWHSHRVRYHSRVAVPYADSAGHGLGLLEVAESREGAGLSCWTLLGALLDHVLFVIGCLVLVLTLPRVSLCLKLKGRRWRNICWASRVQLFWNLSSRCTVIELGKGWHGGKRHWT